MSRMRRLLLVVEICGRGVKMKRAVSESSRKHMQTSDTDQSVGRPPPPHPPGCRMAARLGSYPRAALLVLMVHILVPISFDTPPANLIKCDNSQAIYRPIIPKSSNLPLDELAPRLSRQIINEDVSHPAPKSSTADQQLADENPSEGQQTLPMANIEYQQKPSFANSKPDDLIVIASSWQNEAYLPCKIFNLDQDQTVSWIRKRDSVVLTIDKLRLIDDTRFQLAQSSEDWTLVLAQPNHQDAGLYECQVSSMEPKLSQLVELRLVEADSWISNFSSLFVRPNQQINVTCTIEAPQKTDFVYWYKNKEPIHFDSLKSRQSTSVIRIDDRSAGSSRPEKQDSRPKGGPESDNNDNSLAEDDRDEPPDTRDSGPDLGPTEPLRGRRAYARDKQSESWPELSDQQSQPDVDSLGGKRGSGDLRSKTRSSGIQLLDSDEVKANKFKAKIKRKKTKTNGGVATTSNGNNSRGYATIRSSSSLIIREAQLNDTANYTCLPSNAKPSHINIVVIENGPESQPEKRSLQATDSASSYMTLVENFKLLITVALLRASRIVPLVDWSPRFDSSPSMGETEDLSLVTLMGRLIMSQDLHRLIITAIASYHLAANIIS